MSGRVLRGCCKPSHVHARKGKGWREDEATGFVRYAEDFVDDTRQGQTSPQFADTTPGFGTFHPQDVVNLGSLDDPSAIPDARPPDNADRSKADMRISDQEVKASIQEGRAPRVGY